MIKKIGITIVCMFCCFIYLKGQNMDDINQRLISQGAWFLFSLKTEERVENEVLTQIEFFKKEDVSSLYFDTDNKLYTVFSKFSSEIFEDRWKLIDETHFVMVSPTDGTSQVVEILQIDDAQLVLRNCADIENGTSCLLYTYLSTKEGWQSDAEIDKLNATGIVQLDKMIP